MSHTPLATPHPSPRAPAPVPAPAPALGTGEKWKGGREWGALKSGNGARFPEMPSSLPPTVAVIAVCTCTPNFGSNVHSAHRFWLKLVGASSGLASE